MTSLPSLSSLPRPGFFPFIFDLTYIDICLCRYDYLFDPDERDDHKLACKCRAPNCRKYIN